MAKEIKKTKIRLCDHLETDILGIIDEPARLRCGQDRKEWVWNKDQKAYVCVVDPEKDKKLNVIGQLFK